MSLCCGNVNRGVAVAEGKVFVVTLNAHIIALDAETGKKVWDQTYGDVRAGESATVAPLVVKDMVIVGSSGGEFGNARPRRRVQARDRRARVADATWSPSPGSPAPRPGPTTARPGSAAARTAGSRRTFDPELNLLYFGTGNPCPDFDGGVREGDNLHTDSGVAVDVDTGEIKAHFQYTPHDLWDYDSTMEHILFDLDGQKLAAHFDKNGFLYILDRTDMEPVRVVPFVDRIDWGEVDEKGNVTPRRSTPTRRATRSTSGPARPAPRSGRTRATARRPSCSTPPSRTSARPPRGGAGSSRRASRTGARASRVDLDDMAGSISAFDPRTGARGWRWRNDIPMCSSVLATGGDLVFAGEPTGEFNALDARPASSCGSSSAAAATTAARATYSIDGRQYIAVPTGWGAWTEGFLPGMLGAGQGSSLFVFALPED